MIDRALLLFAQVCLLVIAALLAILVAGTIAAAQDPRGVLPLVPAEDDGDWPGAAAPYEPKVLRLCKFEPVTVTRGRLMFRLPDGAHSFYVYATRRGTWEVIAVHELSGESCLFASGSGFDFRVTTGTKERT